MEARSLTSLNLLAGNPPQYPENPSEEIQGPLMLYISRVPGTRDVILSPFKPQLKNVTTEDVASSLYYVHLDLPSSELPNPSPPWHGGRFSEDGSPARTIARKPIPVLTLASATESPPGGNEQLRPTSTREDHTLHPSRGRRTSFNSQNDEHFLSVPSRSMNDSGLGPSDGSSDPAHHRPAPEPLMAVPKRKPLRPKALANPPAEGPDIVIPPPQGRSLADGNIHGKDYTRSPADSTGLNGDSHSLSPKKRGEYPTSPFTLRLIRRDPGTGDQWNVGQISSHEMGGLSGGYNRFSTYSSAYTELPPSQHPPIDIQIETSGYARFRSMPSRRSMDVSAVTPRPSIGIAPLARSDTGMYFSRQVVMSYSKSWTSNLKSRLYKIEQAARKRALGRHESDASINSMSSADFTTGPTASSRQDHQGLKAQGYVFTSPWGSKCEFRTGNGGRSLRCHHILHDGPSTAYNPLVANIEANTPKPAAVVVSELRFNLPGAKIFPSSDDSKDSKERRLGHFGKLLKSATGVNYHGGEVEGTVSPFDMDLGAEKAGGGNHGRRAKLGKLIICHDGLKMLDLVVAANMGLWWGAWERSF